jgi:hypothetical protein
VERESDVIRRQMHRTRESLHRKVVGLEKSLLGTVDDAATAATDVVENVTETVQETVENVKHTVEDTVKTVTRTLDVRRHVRHHPVWWVAGSVFAGYIVGSFVPRLRRRREPAEAAPQRSHVAPQRSYAHAGNGHGNGHRKQPKQQKSGPSALGLLTSLVMPGVQKLKDMALKETTGFLQRVVSRSVPEGARPQVTDIINKGLTALGVEPMRVEQNGGQHGERDFDEVGRPVGPAQGSHQANLGVHHRR